MAGGRWRAGQLSNGKQGVGGRVAREPANWWLCRAAGANQGRAAPCCARREVGASGGLTASGVGPRAVTPGFIGCVARGGAYGEGRGRSTSARSGRRVSWRRVLWRRPRPFLSAASSAPGLLRTPCPPVQGSPCLSAPARVAGGQGPARGPRSGLAPRARQATERPPPLCGAGPSVIRLLRNTRSRVRFLQREPASPCSGRRYRRAAPEGRK